MGYEMDRLTLQQISLPTQPAVAEALLRLAGSPELDAHQLADVVCLDPALSARMLRFVNSPLFAPRIPIETVRRAIIVMGLQASLNIALTFYVSPVLTEDYQGLDYRLFWTRSLLAAKSAQELGKAGGLANGEELWAAALLQDLGMVAMDQALGTAFYRDLNVSQADHPGVSRYEKMTLGRDHARVGSWMLRGWGLPEPIITAVSLSHERHAMPDNGQWQFTRYLRVGAAIADAFLAGTIDADCAPSWLVNVVSTDLTWSASQAKETLEKLLPELADFQAVSVLQSEEWAPSEDLMNQAAKLLEKRNAGVTDDGGEVPVSSGAEGEAGSVDEITGLVTKPRFHDQLAAMLDEAKARREELSLVFVRLFDLTDVSRVLGQHVADRIAKVVVGCLEHSLRRGDVLARYGDSCFVLALRDADVFCGTSVIERLKRSLDENLSSIRGRDKMNLDYTFSRVTHGDGQLFESAEAFIDTGLNDAYQAQGKDKKASADLLRRAG